MVSSILVVLGVFIFSFISVLIWKRLYRKGNSSLAKPKATNVYVLRTHVWNNHVEKTYLKLQEQLGAERVFMVFDETKGAIKHPHIKWNDKNGAVAGPAIITINEADCQAINKLHNIGCKAGMAHRVEAQVCACYKAIRRNYDYMWLIEYDVYCNNFKVALEKFDKVEADMLTKGTANMKQSNIRTVKRNKGWFWWPYLIGDINNVPMEQRRGCFFPINRFSKKFLSVLEQNLSKSSGYCEVYFPTLCHINGLLLKAMPMSTFGIFIHMPTLSIARVNRIRRDDNRLYHPVKELPESSSADSKKPESVSQSQTLLRSIKTFVFSLFIAPFDYHIQIPEKRFIYYSE